MSKLFSIKSTYKYELCVIWQYQIISFGSWNGCRRSWSSEDCSLTLERSLQINKRNPRNRETLNGKVRGFPTITLRWKMVQVLSSSFTVFTGDNGHLHNALLLQCVSRLLHFRQAISLMDSLLLSG